MLNKLALISALALACSPASAQSSYPVIAGAQTCTQSAAALPSSAMSRPSGTLWNGVVLKADSANTGVVYVGPSGVATSGAAQGYPLKAGEAISYGTTNLAAIYMICGNTTDVLHFTGN